MKADAIKRFVLDASVAVAWCFEDERNSFSEGILDLLEQGAQGLVPAIWPFEVANALLAAERRKRISTVAASALLQYVARLPIAVEAADSHRAFEHILPLARRRDLTEYDAAYLDLALREGIPLATLDAKLRRAARLAGVETKAI